MKKRGRQTHRHSVFVVNYKLLVELESALPEKEFILARHKYPTLKYGKDLDGRRFAIGLLPLQYIVFIVFEETSLSSMWKDILLLLLWYILTPGRRRNLQTSGQISH